MGLFTMTELMRSVSITVMLSTGERRMRENRLSGSEGGGEPITLSLPYRKKIGLHYVVLFSPIPYRPSAVDGDELPANHLRLVGAEERDGICHVFRFNDFFRWASVRLLRAVFLRLRGWRETIRIGNPASIPLTRIPFGASSDARVRVRDSRRLSPRR